MRERLGIDACAVSDAHEAVRASALVVTATTASAPVIEGEWLDEGTHLSGVGANTRTKRELEGRSSSKEITIFKSVGVALQDIAVAVSLFENAVRLGLGTQLDPYVAGRHFVETR